MTLTRPYLVYHPEQFRESLDKLLDGCKKEAALRLPDDGPRDDFWYELEANFLEQVLREWYPEVLEQWIKVGSARYQHVREQCHIDEMLIGAYLYRLLDYYNCPISDGPVDAIFSCLLSFAMMDDCIEAHTQDLLEELLIRYRTEGETQCEAFASFLSDLLHDYQSNNYTVYMQTSFLRKGMFVIIIEGDELQAAKARAEQDAIENGMTEELKHFLTTLKIFEEAESLGIGRLLHHRDDHER